MFQNLDFKHMSPMFSEKEKEDIRLYYAFSKEYEKEIQEKSLKEFEAHPIFGPLIKNIPQEVREANNKQSDTLLREAIFENTWEPYIKHLMLQGVQYAHMGLDFKAWYEVVGMVRRYYIPIIRRLWSKEPDRISSVGNGMNILFDYVMCIIGESFIHERNRRIEQQNNRLEGMVKELESFAYIISHDLKTPLRGIASLSDWLAEDYKDKLDSTGKEYLDLLKNRVLRLEALIDGVLTYSRAGRIDAEIENIDLTVLVKDVIEMAAFPSNVQIQINNPLPTLKTVKYAMMQVFANLIGNAVKHSDKTKVEITVGCTEQVDDWLFYVKDNGPGIDAEFQGKVFQIFQTLKTKDEMNSTGIGLSVVKKIVDNMGGKIWIESKANEGSTFFFTIKKQLK
ncbi:MAG TPA: ATP-binding protein [Bacteroidia bacterium]|jgi:signal transduction histidine kinase|nr:ATP-binding protein [Bacteroidia bacterium]